MYREIIEPSMRGKVIDSVFTVSSNRIRLGESMDTDEKHLLTYSTNYLYKETHKTPLFS